MRLWYKAGIIYLLSTVVYVYASDKEAPNPNGHNSLKRVITVDSDDEPNPKRQKLEGGEYSDDTPEENEILEDKSVETLGESLNTVENNKSSTNNIKGNSQKSGGHKRKRFKEKTWAAEAIATHQEDIKRFLDQYKETLENSWANIAQDTLRTAQYKGFGLGRSDSIAELI